MNAILQDFLYALKVALMNDDIPEIPPAELDMAIDEDNRQQGRGPERRAAEQGVADMQTRIAYLNTELRKNNTRLNCLGSTEHEVRSLNEVRTKLTTDLQDAQRRLAEYQAQLKGKN